MKLPDTPTPPGIPPAALADARREAARTGRPLPRVLEETLGLEPPVVMAALADLLQCRLFAMADLDELPPAFDCLPLTEAVQRQVLPLRTSEGDFWLVCGDPFQNGLTDWADLRLKQPFRLGLAHPADLAACLARHEESQRALDPLLAQSEAGSRRTAADELSLKAISEDASPVVRLTHSTLYDALKSGASDIHLESDGQGLTIKYRIDGVLSQVGQVAGVALAEQVISRVKVMAELDIAERRIPQDGRFKVAMQGREVDVRVSVMPSIFGEDAVLRILDKQALSESMRGLRLDTLGFDGIILARLRRLAAEPYGMLLVTGPTGSGKTTTLYAALSEINHGQDKIVTIEDPVEYQLPGVLQIPVNEKKGLTFARGLRSILRHDPDKIMVGEIRDAETAQIAVQAALTGHLVFTTVHANNVFDVIGRFLHMGVDPYSFVSALNAIVAQRLVRVNCPRCSELVTPDAALLAESGLEAGAVAHFRFRAGRGCGHCRGSGYRGRKAIAELLVLDDTLREMIVARAAVRRIKEAARQTGMRTLREAALALVAAGETTLTEINRVTFVA
ncbi:MAG: GspE/PulE family protein [Burkholderiales bacterium]